MTVSLDPPMGSMALGMRCGQWAVGSWQLAVGSLLFAVRRSPFALRPSLFWLFTFWLSWDFG